MKMIQSKGLEIWAIIFKSFRYSKYYNIIVECIYCVSLNQTT